MGSGRSSADLDTRSSKSSSTTTSICNVRVGQEGGAQPRRRSDPMLSCAGYAKPDPSGHHVQLFVRMSTCSSSMKTSSIMLDR